ncbi:MAG TPA: DUF2148 domain-containing protein [Candidatus Wallbacteria bacterium]|mgnify:CR=1 FL=1|nr:DUF2148 domain-containing protein [Candidatus Wallbacteria bacterium]
MAIIHEEELRSEFLMSASKRILAAARTAPKGCGKDNTVMAVATADDIKKISEKLRELSKKYEHPGFARDAENILSAGALLLFGTRISPMGLKKCGMCGFENCAAKNEKPDIPCVFNTGDLGIAIGSAVSVAMDMRIDNRIMYTVGQAVLEMGIFDKSVKIVYAVPLSVSAKNPFFDRK